MKKTNRGAIALSKFFQSQQEAATILGIKPSMLSLLLSGKRMPSIEIAAKIEKHWEVPCRYWTEDVEIQDKKDKTLREG